MLELLIIIPLQILFVILIATIYFCLLIVIPLVLIIWFGDYFAPRFIDPLFAKFKDKKEEVSQNIEDEEDNIKKIKFKKLQLERRKTVVKMCFSKEQADFHYRYVFFISRLREDIENIYILKYDNQTGLKEIDSLRKYNKTESLCKTYEKPYFDIPFFSIIYVDSERLEKLFIDNHFIFTQKRIFAESVKELFSVS